MRRLLAGVARSTVRAAFLTLLLGATATTASAPTVPVANFQGAWVSTASYGAGAIVTYNGELYICLIGNSHVPPPTNAADWALLSVSGFGTGNTAGAEALEAGVPHLTGSAAGA